MVAFYSLWAVSWFLLCQLILFCCTEVMTHNTKHLLPVETHQFGRILINVHLIGCIVAIPFTVVYSIVVYRTIVYSSFYFIVAIKNLLLFNCSCL